MLQTALKPEERPLLKPLREEETALFVGSGVSRWSGLPSWPELLTALLGECQALGGSLAEAQAALTRKDMIGAAGQLCDQMSSSEIAWVFRRTLKFGKGKPHNIHRLIFSLGIRRFVTTNYDDLLEKQAARSCPTIPFLTVTNRKLAELADIQKAAANHFIFKPHGDLNDAESLIVSETHYRSIFGDTGSPVKQALEHILVSRPIIFIGYSLTDPDLKFILEALRGRYRGNVGDLWAIFPDASEAQKKELWTNFRIRAVSYKTTHNSRAGHRELLRMLAGLRYEIASAKESSRATSSSNDSGARLTVGLARYAARLIIPALPELPIHASLPWTYRSLDSHSPVDHLDGRAVREILMNSTIDVAIEGAAGSGKSWSVSHFMSQCAQKLLQVLDEGIQSPTLTRSLLPVRLDCQVYEGSFSALVSLTVPLSLDLRAASRTHTILFLVDSIDEMPARYLEDQSWSRDLAELQSEFADVRTIYLSRRRDLIPDPTLPSFRVDPLSDDVIKRALSEVSIDINDLADDFIEQLRTPYLLQMACKLLPRDRTLSSTLKLTNALVEQAFGKLPSYSRRERILSALVATAAATLTGGRETFPLWLLAKELNRVGEAENNGVIDRLVEVGFLRSETQRRLRFSHRILTEYFTSRWIAQNWKRVSFSLRESAASVYLHNAMVWAAAIMAPSEREQFIEALLDLDYSITCAIANSAEIDREATWARVLQRIALQPPNSDVAFALAYQLEHADVPREVMPQLRLLTTLRDSELAGWALSKLIPEMSCEEVKAILERFIGTDLDWNEWNWAGHALGQRLDHKLLTRFKQALVGSTFAPEESEDNSEHLADQNRAHAFETVIAGLKADLLADLLRWSSNQSKALRGVLVQGVSKLDTADAERFMVRQFDLGVPHATFCLFLRLKYGQPPWRSRILRFAQRRMDLLTDGISSTPRNILRWRLGLLRTLVEQDLYWWEGLERRAHEEKNKSTKRTLTALIPGQERRVLRQRVRQLLHHGTPLSPIDRALFDVFGDIEPAALFSEGDVLSAFESHGWSIWYVVGVFLNGSRMPRARQFRARQLFVSQADAWIAFLHAIKASCSDTIDQAATFVAENLSREARNRVIARANDPSDPGSTFILLQVVRRMQTVTTDDLTDEACQRLLSSFLNPEYDDDPIPTPGSIATERYIREVVIPFASNDLNPDVVEDMERILMEAGARHGVRYHLPHGDLNQAM